MQENINEKLSKILAGMGGEDKIKEFMSSPAGKGLKNSLSDSDKKKLLEKFMSMDSEDMKRKLKNADLSALSKLSSEDIARMLKKR